MVLDEPGRPLQARELPDLELDPSRPGDLLVEVHACGVCRTDLHIRDGEVRGSRLPVVPGHQVVATVLAVGPDAAHAPGVRVGIPWLGWTDGTCRFCTSGRENLCESAQFTGLDRDGGYATRAVADARYAFALPDGFGAAAHIVCQVAVHEGRRVFAFARAGDDAAAAFARSLGAEWAGAAEDRPPEELDAAIIFAPVGALVPLALRAVARGGTVVCAGIHMSPIPGFAYDVLWGERVVRSVANLTRRDGEAFFGLAASLPLAIAAEAVPLAQANAALDRLRTGRVTGALVLVP